MKHEVRAAPELVSVNDQGIYYPRMDVQQWMLGSMGKRAIYSSKWGWKGRWSVSGRGTFSLFSFASKSDAVLFKLRWGGM
jgi:hypothetical protein